MKLRDIWGQTALHLAARNGSIEAVNLLLQQLGVIYDAPDATIKYKAGCTNGRTLNSPQKKTTT
jgi:ankyrin repeat protein